MSNVLIKEAERLYKMGWGVHWIKPNSKAPVKSGWANDQRDDWKTVKAEFRPNYGLGVRMGSASKADGGFLANVDVDIKSSDPRHEKEALDFLEKKFPGLLADAPIVKTGYGLRLFCKTPMPLPSGKIGASNEKTKVLMPSTEITRQQELAVKDGLISEKELKDGYRIRPAWEVEFMSRGRQVVLPPSVHPETGKKYIWRRELNGHLPEVNFDVTGLEKKRQEKAAPSEFKFKVVPVDTVYLDEETEEAVINGAGVSDRSAYLMTVSLKMLRAGYSDDEILSLLTDRDLFLGSVAYESHHANTDDRKKAAYWIWQYTLLKAKEKLSAAAAFEDEAVIETVLEEKDATAQKEELVEATDWRLRIKRSGQKGEGPPKNLAYNVVLILENIYGPELFREDKFSGYRVFGQKVDWGGEIGEEFSDRHRPLMMDWFSRKWGFEPNDKAIFDAVAIIAAKHTFHPIKDQLYALKWDGTARIDTWLEDYLGAHETSKLYLREVSRKFLCGMIARALEPGCQFDHMLILKGPQGLRKSTALRILAGDKYFTTTVLRPGEKDTVAKMNSKWLVEFGELSNIKKDVLALKNFLTERVDRDRLPYERLARDFPRSCVFAGTTNQDDFLYDDTGSRRFWPVSVGVVDIEGLIEVRDQLFAEALVLYECGEALYLSKKAEAEAFEEHKKFAAISHDAIKERVEKCIENHFPDKPFSMNEFIDAGMFKDDMQTQKRIGSALRHLGFEKKDFWQDNKNTKKWFLARIAPPSPKGARGLKL